MKTVSFLRIHLVVLSLAIVTIFSAVQAVTPQKKKKKQSSATAIVEMLVHQAATGGSAITAKEKEKNIVSVSTSGVSTTVAGTTHGVATTIDTAVVVGKGDGKDRNVVVFGDVRAAGELVAGQIGELQKKKDESLIRDDYGNFLYKTPGKKHIIGITSLDPHSQQFRIVFKDKTALSHGAFVDLDFVTTATGHLGNVAFTEADDLKASGKKATVGVRLHHVFCHPQMSADQILAGLAGAEADQAKFIMNGYLDGANPTDQDSLSDLRLKAHVRVEEGSTNNVNFGFVPASVAYPVNVTVAVVGDDDTYAQVVDTGFYDVGWATRKDRPVYEVGTLSYQIASDNVVSAETVSQVANGELLPADVFQLFTDEELVSLLAVLKDYFGEDVAKMRDYLVANRHQLSRAFHEIH